MEYVTLGRSGLKVSRIGLGAWQFGAREWGWGRDYGKADALATVERALEIGVNFIDTAEIYGGGRSEEIIKEALGGRRDEVVLATKVAPWHLQSGQVVKAASRSLRRLSVDCIDLYQVHWPNPVIPIRSTMKGMERLIREGKIRYVGVSNFGSNRLRAAQEALSRSEIVSNQVKYNLLQRKVEEETLPFAKKTGVSIIAYSPLAQGLLTGKYGAANPPPADVRTANSLFSGRNLRAAQGILGALKEIARIHNRTVAQVSLNWLIKDPAVLAIPGAKRPQQLEENAGAAGWSLTAHDISQIDQLTQAFNPETIFSVLSIPVRAIQARLRGS